MSSVLIGLLIPFLGTSLGAGMVYFMKERMSPRLEKILLGFASGVMVAASVWSLLDPAIGMSDGKKYVWFPAAAGFLMGVFFLLLLDSLIPHLHLDAKEPEGLHSKLRKTTMMVLAVTLHNIPEGMAVGVSIAGALHEGGITMAAALALSVGIAIQNFPEGAIISMPLKAEGTGKHKAFLLGVLSGVVEPAAAALAIALTGFIVPLLPYVLSFAAGAMMYVVVEELILESQNGGHSNIGTIGFALGFVLMMILDVALS